MPAICLPPNSENTFPALLQIFTATSDWLHGLSRPSETPTDTAPGISATPSRGGYLGAPWGSLRDGLERCTHVASIPLGEFKHGRSAYLRRSPRDELHLYRERQEFFQLNKLGDHLFVPAVHLKRRLIW
jgi:hypothetical protein